MSGDNNSFCSPIDTFIKKCAVLFIQNNAFKNIYKKSKIHLFTLIYVQANLIIRLHYMICDNKRWTDVLLVKCSAKNDN